MCVYSVPGQYISVSSLRKKKSKSQDIKQTLITCIMTFISFFRFEFLKILHLQSPHMRLPLYKIFRNHGQALSVIISAVSFEILIGTNFRNLILKAGKILFITILTEIDKKVHLQLISGN